MISSTSVACEIATVTMMDQSNDQDVVRLRERVSLLEFESSRRDVVDRIRTVIQRLPDEDYEAVLEAISGALTELGVSYEDCCVQVVDRDQSVTMYVKGAAGWFRSTHEVDLHLFERFQRESAPVYRPDLILDDPFGEAHWASDHVPPVRCIVDAPWSHGTLSVNSTEPNAFPGRDIETLGMLAAVLSEAFVRIEDLKALRERGQEVQREARIREAEHAIRLTISQMEDAEDLPSIVLEIETQLGNMDVKLDSCSVQIVNETCSDFSSTIARSVGYRENNAEKYPWVLDVFRSGKLHYQPCTKDDSPMPPGISVVDVPFSHGTLAINRFQPDAFTSGDIDLLGRFAAILSDGFQRFVGIVERNQNQRLTNAMARVREQVLLMESERGLDRVLVCVAESLRDAGVRFTNCGINLIDSTETPSMTSFDTNERAWLESDRVGGAETVVKIWQEGRAACRNKSTHPVELKRLSRAFGYDVRSVLDVPFAHGTLAVHSTAPDAFSSADFDILKAVSEALSVGVSRMQDLRLLAEQNESLEREIGERERAEEALQKAHDELEQRVEERTAEREKAEEAWHQTAARLAGILDSAHDAIVSIDQAERIIQFNSGAEKIFGYEAREVLGHSVSVLIPDEFRGIHSRHLAAFSSSPDRSRGKEDRPDISGRRKNGEIFPAETSISEVGHGGQKIFTVILRDITERKRLEEQLRQSQKMEALGQLTAGIAHNFNNRLMVILNTFEAARLRGSVCLEDLPVAEASALRAAEIVDQLMLFSRAGAAPGQETVDLRQILNGVIEIGRRSFDPGIVVVGQIPERIPPVSGDASQLDQVFLNLLLNARDAVESAEQPASRITISVEEVSFGETEVAVRPSTLAGSYLGVHVTDDGIGMDEDTRQRVFEPFFTTKEVGQGTGLGLATAYAIVQQHDGWIECHSQPGDGATFSVYLPVAPDQTTAPEVEAARTVKGGSETILFVEDDEDVRRPLLGLLRTCGYHVLVAADGKEGWTFFQQHQHDIDLILLDLSMPNMSGQELLARIRTVDPAAVVLISSGRADAVTQLPGETVLRKPYGLTKALTTIRDMLDQHGDRLGSRDR